MNFTNKNQAFAWGTREFPRKEDRHRTPNSPESRTYLTVQSYHPINAYEEFLNLDREREESKTKALLYHRNIIWIGEQRDMYSVGFVGKQTLNRCPGSQVPPPDYSLSIDLATKSDGEVEYVAKLKSKKMVTVEDWGYDSLSDMEADIFGVDEGWDEELEDFAFEDADSD